MNLAWIGAITGPAAIVISACALGITWQNARRDAARWHNQREPDLTVVGSTEPGGGTVISFVTQNPAGLDCVRVTLLTEPGERSPVAGFSRTTTDQQWTTGTVGPLTLGEPVKLNVWRQGPTAGHVLRLQCVCEVAGESWPLYRECTLPAEHS